MSLAECAVEMKPVSNCDGANRTPRFKQAWEKTGEHFQIASPRTDQIDNRRGSKEQTKHRTEPVTRDVDLCVS